MNDPFKDCPENGPYEFSFSKVGLIQEGLSKLVDRLVRHLLSPLETRVLIGQIGGTKFCWEEDQKDPDTTAEEKERGNVLVKSLKPIAANHPGGVEALQTLSSSSSSSSCAVSSCSWFPHPNWTEEEIEEFSRVCCVQALCGKGEETVLDKTARDTLKVNTTTGFFLAFAPEESTTSSHVGNQQTISTPISTTSSGSTTRRDNSSLPDGHQCGKSEFTAAAESSWSSGQLRVLLEPTFDPSALNSVLDEIQRKMVPGNKIIGASLHDILLYKKDMFFRRHRDSKKEQFHTITLSVTLAASPDFEGGEVRFYEDEDGRDIRFKAWGNESEEEEDASALHEGKDKVGGAGIGVPGAWGAWFCSEYHQVTPVKKGWRLAATFNVLVSTDVIPVSPYAPSTTAISSPSSCNNNSRILQLLPFDCLSLVGTFLPLPGILSTRQVSKEWNLATAPTGVELFEHSLRYHLAKTMRLCQRFGVDTLGFVLRHQYSNDGEEAPHWETLRGVDRLVSRGFAEVFGSQSLQLKTVELFFEKGEEVESDKTSSKGSSTEKASCCTSSFDSVDDLRLMPSSRSPSCCDNDDIHSRYPQLPQEGYIVWNGPGGETGKENRSCLLDVINASRDNPGRADNIRISHAGIENHYKVYPGGWMTDESTRYMNDIFDLLPKWYHTEERDNPKIRPELEWREFDHTLPVNAKPFKGTIWLNSCKDLDKHRKASLLSGGALELWGNHSCFSIFFYRDTALTIKLPFAATTTKQPSTTTTTTAAPAALATTVSAVNKDKERQRLSLSYTAQDEIPTRNFNPRSLTCPETLRYIPNVKGW